MRKCLVTGTFDPITKGHEDIIKRAMALFDEVIIAILVNPDKKPLFSEEERVELIKTVFPNVEVIAYDGLAVTLAKEKGAIAFVRGIRNEMDAKYENEMADFNKTLGVDTVMLCASKDLCNISATNVRQMIETNELKCQYVSDSVWSKVCEWRRNNGGH